MQCACHLLSTILYRAGHKVYPHHIHSQCALMADRIPAAFHVRKLTIECSSNCLPAIPPCFRIIFNGIWIWHGSEEDLCNGSKCISSNKVYTRIVRCCCFTYRTAWKHFQLSKSAPIHPHTHYRANLSGQWWQPKRLHNPIQWNIILHRNRLPTDRTSTWARHGIELCSNYFVLLMY